MAEIIRNLVEVGNPLKSANHWRERADKARTLAVAIKNPGASAMMYEVAASYDRLARRAEERASRKPDR
jgi:hypothetical protein